MSAESVLGTILANQKINELAEFNVIELISFMLGQLNERERDIISRRYGLKSGQKEILEAIGRAHNLTRERIRQIEVASLQRLQELKNLEQIKKLRKIIIMLLEEHGGAMEKNYLLANLVHFSAKDKISEKNRQIYENFYTLLLAKILDQDFTLVADSKRLLPCFRLNYQTVEHFEELVGELENILAEKKQVMATAEILKLARQLEAFARHQEKFLTDSAIDLSSVLQSYNFAEDIEAVNSQKAVYSALKAARTLEQNVFGYWGLGHWPEIKPRNLNDKIYLVLKNKGKPMHFADIAKAVEEIGFDNRPINTASAHNELILDKKYVLVGRGIYGLREWGLRRGTVADVIADILEKAKEPLSREEIIKRVLAERIVKKATIALALTNRQRFERLPDGRYALKKITE